MLHQEYLFGSEPRGDAAHRRPELARLQHLDRLHFIKLEAAAVRIPYLYFLAFVLVHEWVHCLPAGWNSEIPSLQAQVAFVQTWPEGAMRQRALWYARSLFSFVDENGHWIR